MRRHERGAALIAALMLSMVLSAIGVMSLQSTLRSLNQSGNYRMRRQAQVASDSAVQFVSQRVGNSAQVYWRFMQETQRRDSFGVAGANARESIDRGAFMVVDAQTYQQTGNLLNAASGTRETGLFSRDAATVSHEAGLTTKNAFFQVMLRDPIEGPPAPGYSQDYCFKKLTFFSKYVYGDFRPDGVAAGANSTFENPVGQVANVVSDSNEWSRPTLSAMGRNGLESYIGPIECGAR